MGGKCTTLQVTAEGGEILKKYNIFPGQKFDTRLLRRLLRSGDAFSHRGGTDLPNPDQREFDFEENHECDLLLPKCEIYGPFEELDFVVIATESCQISRILSANAKAEISAKIVLTVPLWLLSKSSLNRLEQQGRVPSDCPVVLKLQEWLDDSSEDRWNTVNTHIFQDCLPLSMEGELGL